MNRNSFTAINEQLTFFWCYFFLQSILWTIHGVCDSSRKANMDTIRWCCCISLLNRMNFSWIIFGIGFFLFSFWKFLGELSNSMNWKTLFVHCVLIEPLFLSAVTSEWSKIFFPFYSCVMKWNKIPFFYVVQDDSSLVSPPSLESYNFSFFLYKLIPL